MSKRRIVTALVAVATAAAFALLPLTAGGQEGRPEGATRGPVPPADRAASGQSATNGWDGDGPAPRTLVHSGDSTIQGSLCVGFDCSNNEPMGFATIKIEENNLRIAAADSSTVSGFPTTDWQIEFNSSASGGGSYFMVRDCGTGGAAGSVDSTCGGTPMLTIEGGADNESIHVDSSGNQGGNVGFGTATPVVDLHTLSGNTPTLRLEQDNSSGFTPQSWDVAGNESNFFIRDVTNGSSLPIRIEPGVASNTLYLDNQERIGINTSAPEAAIDVRATNASMVGTGNSLLLLRRTGGAAALTLEDEDTGGFWNLTMTDNATEFRISRSGTGANEFTISEGGVMSLRTLVTAPATAAIGDVYADTSGGFCVATAANTWTNVSGVGNCS